MRQAALLIFNFRCPQSMGYTSTIDILLRFYRSVDFNRRDGRCKENTSDLRHCVQSFGLCGLLYFVNDYPLFGIILLLPGLLLQSSFVVSLTCTFCNISEHSSSPFKISNHAFIEVHSEQRIIILLFSNDWKVQECDPGFRLPSSGSSG